MSNAPSDLVKQTIGRALGRIPSGVFVLTVEHQQQALAMLASWVQQAGFDPPAVSVAIANQRPAAAMVRAAGRFGLSILGEQDMQLMKRYARGIEPGQDPFSGVKTMKTPAAVPVLADALGWMECRIIQVCQTGADHDLFIAEVTAGEVLKEGKSFTHQRGNGFHY
jgi:3-hydroxy-9,10-secoandrosta-1,3,5(10)-triene-9,17-dione monooxygenase reductase component